MKPEPLENRGTHRRGRHGTAARPQGAHGAPGVTIAVALASALVLGHCATNQPVPTADDARPDEPAARAEPAPRPKLRLVEGGRSAFVIHHEASAASSVKLGAEELRDYVRKATGTELPIVDRPATQMICLGDCAASREVGFSIGDIPLEGFRIATRHGSVYIHGPDTPDGQTTPGKGMSRGTLFGVYAFLERHANVRWVLPGDDGESVPKTSTLEVPEGESVDAPDFPRRIVRRVNTGRGGREDVRRWGLRNRLGYSLSLEHYHNWQYVIKPAQHARHPEYFALRGGKRGKPGSYHKLCTTNSDVVRIFADAAISAFKKDPKRLCFTISPPDQAGWCECDACRATDEKDPEGRPSVTGRILRFYNAVAELVRPHFPDRFLCGYVYWDYGFPPRDRPVKIAPNVFLVWAPAFAYGFTLFRPELRELWEQTLAGWEELTQNLAYYDLPVSIDNNAGAPCPPGLKILKLIFPRIKRARLKGVYIYGDTAWGHAALHNWLIARLEWDADADVDALLDEFCVHAYGRGAVQMQQVYRLLDEAMEAHFLTDRKAGGRLTPGTLQHVYAANFGRIEQLHQQALARAVDRGARARLEMFGDNLKVLCYFLGAQGFLKNLRDSAYYLTEEEYGKFVAAREGSLAIKKPVQIKKPAPPRPNRGFVLRPAGTTEGKPLARYELRGDTDLILYARSSVQASVTFTRVNTRDALVVFVLRDRLNRELRSGFARAGVQVDFEAVAGEYYALQVVAGTGSYEISTKMPFAVDARVRPLHFLGRVTPLYFFVPEGLTKFTLTLTSGYPRETALVKIFDPCGRLRATMSTAEKSSDQGTVTLGPKDHAVWRIDTGKAQKGYLDDVRLRLGRGLAGLFSFRLDGVIDREEKAVEAPAGSGGRFDIKVDANAGFGVKLVKADESTTSYSKGTRHLSFEVDVAADSWKRMVGRFVPDGSGTVELRLRGRWKTKNWVYFDDIEIIGATLANGDMESKYENGNPVGWRIYRNKATGAAAAIIDDAELAHSGRKCLVVQHDHSAGQFIKVEADRPVEISAWVRYAPDQR